MTAAGVFCPPERITICEVGLRDGLQNEAVSVTAEQKLELIGRMRQAGLTSVEVGSFVHPRKVPQMADTDEVCRRLDHGGESQFRFLVLNQKGIERAKEAGAKRVKLTVSASRTHSVRNAGAPPGEVLGHLEQMAEYAKEAGMRLTAAVATAFGCPFEGRIPFASVQYLVSAFVQMGIREISLSDTAGMANPRQVYEYCGRIRREFPGITWNLHFHNTRGMGFANVLAGMAAGVTGFDSSFGGLGGCPFAPGATGNIATEDLVQMCEAMGIETGVNLDLAVLLAERVQELAGHPLAGSFLLKAGKIRVSGASASQ